MPSLTGLCPLFPVSVQEQPGRVHFLPSVQPRPRSRPLDELGASQSTLCSLLFTLTPSWESYRSLEPAIKSVNGSNTHTHTDSQTNSSLHTSTAIVKFQSDRLKCMKRSLRLSDSQTIDSSGWFSAGLSFFLWEFMGQTLLLHSLTLHYKTH